MVDVSVRKFAYLSDFRVPEVFDSPQCLDRNLEAGTKQGSIDGTEIPLYLLGISLEMIENL